MPLLERLPAGYLLIRRQISNFLASDSTGGIPLNFTARNDLRNQVRISLVELQKFADTMILRSGSPQSRADIVQNPRVLLSNELKHDLLLLHDGADDPFLSIDDSVGLVLHFLVITVDLSGHQLILDRHVDFVFLNYLIKYQSIALLPGDFGNPAVEHGLGPGHGRSDGVVDDGFGVGNYLPQGLIESIHLQAWIPLGDRAYFEASYT